MKKLFAALLCVLLLGGCANSSEDVPDRILAQLQNLKEQALSIGNNMNKPYYSYYLPPSIGRRNSTVLSEVFMKDGYPLVMNFDPSSIVIDHFYQSGGEEIGNGDRSELADEFLLPQMREENGVYTYTGNYLTSMNHVYPYTLQIAQSSGQYLLYLNGGMVKMYTYIPAASVSSFLRSMILIMSSIQYDETSILADFSIKSSKEANKKSLDYLEQNLPSSGSLSDILKVEE